MAQDCVPYTIKAPFPLQVGDMKSEMGRPGVSVIDVTVSEPLDVKEITFKNYYTAFLTVRIQQRKPSDTEGSSTVWRTCIRNLRLMPNPHTEEGSQDYVSLHRHQMLCDTDSVISLRFILRQPSPVWTNFNLEELQINPSGKQSPQEMFSWWLSQLPQEEQLQSLSKCGHAPLNCERQKNLRLTDQNRKKDLPDPEKVSNEVQQMWVLTELMRANQSSASVGRFDVDGCYDINLLSYT
ncbi:hypothetical protein GDO86_007339 [Hymenochirus boettgeri]|uniref:Nicolin 1 n=1 Tax=Hymenochirus boettgeri TaxID=247094 RepID=A0A8T2IWY8_9PIPI|nr:hypothetical protein GDO86_007339 [Hymenochirus boettgeri]